MARGVAEMALALALTMVRRIPEYASEMRDGVVRTNAEVSSGETLFGRKVGLVGFGRIRTSVRETDRAFPGPTRCERSLCRLRT
jgi:phosphoglycerate dehydrogenase-like enzyme